MKNELFSAVIAEARDAPDGDYAERIVVTEEVNGYAVWHDTFHDGVLMLLWEKLRDPAIEQAVAIATEKRANKEPSA